MRRRFARAVPVAVLLLAGCSTTPPSPSATLMGQATAVVSDYPTPVPSPTPPAPSIPPYDFVYDDSGAIRLTGNGTVALTFDDGPDPYYTPLFLDLLASYHVHATFCLVGHRVQENPQIVARIVAEGHTICNHSWDHPLDLASWSDSAILDEMARTTDAIEAAAPGTPVHYFRAPGGGFTPHLVSLANSLGMEGLDWEIDPKDWDSADYGSGPAMVDRLEDVLPRWIYPGCIVLSHDLAKPDTLAAYTALMPTLIGKYTIEPLPPVPPRFAPPA